MALELGQTSHLGFKHSAEVRAKMSASMKGRIISQETRNKISATLMGYKRSTETRAKMSASLIGNKRRLGYKRYQSEEK